MEFEVLQSLGFTNAEAKVYINLIDLGSVKVGRIIERSGLQSSTVHNTLNALVGKGAVSFVLIGKIKEYRAVDPKVILKYFKDREREFEAILPSLKKRYKFPQKANAEVFVGVKGIMSLLLELIGNSKQGDPYYFFAVDQPGLNSEIQKFFEMYDAKRAAKRLVVRGIARSSLKDLFGHRRLLSVKYVDHPIPSNISICNGRMALISWGENPTGILVDSPPIIENMIAFFEEVWKDA